MDETTIPTKYVLEYLQSKKHILEEMVEHSQKSKEKSLTYGAECMVEGMEHGYSFGLQQINDLIFIINQSAECQKRIHEEINKGVQA